MKYGLILPNGRNAFNMSPDDIYFAKNGYHLPGVKKQINLSKQNKKQFDKTLDKWKQSSYTHRSDKKLTIKLGDK